MARSMVSVGTEASRAFWYMVRRVALAAMSAPPSRAATSTWRRTLANTLARTLSLAPFWCLIVAHFERPDMVLSLQKSLVQTQVVGKRGMEGGGHDRPLAAQDRKP